MNYLAHLFLSRKQEDEIIIGNFMADAVKGNLGKSAYNKQFQLGMKVHREIDYYMDKHPIVQLGTKRLYPTYGKYSGIIMDIYYDHILALNWEKYSDLSLNDFAQQQYKIIDQYYKQLPEKIRYWYHFMVKENILVAYAHEKGIEAVFNGMDSRTNYRSGMKTALEQLQLYKEFYTEEFFIFFEEIQLHLSLNFSTFL